MAAQELRWMTYLLTDLGELPRSPPVLYVNNKAMIALCRKYRLEHRTKHIALCYFLARELQQRGQLRLAFMAGLTARRARLARCTLPVAPVVLCPLRLLHPACPCRSALPVAPFAPCPYPLVALCPYPPIALCPCPTVAPCPFAPIGPACPVMPYPSSPCAIRPSVLSVPSVPFVPSPAPSTLRPSVCRALRPVPGCLCHAPCASPSAPCALRQFICALRPSSVRPHPAPCALSARLFAPLAPGPPLEFSVWLLRAQRLLESQYQANKTLWAHAFGDLPEPPTPDSLGADPTAADRERFACERAAITAWKSRDAVACIALSSLLPDSQEAHFTQVRSAREFLTAIKARYSTPTNVLGRLFLPFLFPDLASFERSSDLTAHLHSQDLSYHAACTNALLTLLPPPNGTLRHPRNYAFLSSRPLELFLTASSSTSVTDNYRMYRPVLSHVLASLVMDPRASLSFISALITNVTDFSSTCHLDYATHVVAAPPTRPLSVGGESALGCDALEDRQFELEFLAAASPHILPWASQWRAAMDIEMASYRSTCTYVDEVPPPRANVVDGMWIFKVMWPLGSPPVFKVRYMARGFSQREGVDFFQTFAPTPKMTPLRVLLHVVAQRHYELHSLDFSTAFLLDSLHKEVWLRPHTFLCSVHVDDLVFATADRVALAEVKSELQKRHTCTDLGELRHYLGLQITKDGAARTITLTQSQMVQQPIGPYTELVGCLMYLMTCTRPDLPFPLSILARFVASGRHRPVCLTAAVRVAKYLATTSGMELVLGGRQRVVLTGHCDSSYADDVETQRVKHIDVRYFLLRELQRRGQAHLDFVASEANTADIFTKALLPLLSPQLCFILTGLVTLSLCCFLTPLIQYMGVYKMW
ncbi:unnamed protein product [Closterium sp. NIES-53]